MSEKSILENFYEKSVETQKLILKKLTEKLLPYKAWKLLRKYRSDILISDNVKNFIDNLIADLEKRFEKEKKSILALLENDEKNFLKLLETGNDLEFFLSLKIIKESKIAKYKNKLLEKLEKTVDPFIIATIISVLIDIGDEKDIPIVRKFVYHPDSRVKANAIIFLNKFGINIDEKSKPVKDRVEWYEERRKSTNGNYILYFLIFLLAIFLIYFFYRFLFSDTNKTTNIVKKLENLKKEKVILEVENRKDKENKIKLVKKSKKKKHKKVTSNYKKNTNYIKLSEFKFKKFCAYLENGFLTGYLLIDKNFYYKVLLQTFNLKISSVKKRKVDNYLIVEYKLSFYDFAYNKKTFLVKEYFKKKKKYYYYNKVYSRVKEIKSKEGFEVKKSKEILKYKREFDVEKMNNAILEYLEKARFIRYELIGVIENYIQFNSDQAIKFMSILERKNLFNYKVLLYKYKLSREKLNKYMELMLAGKDSELIKLINKEKSITFPEKIILYELTGKIDKEYKNNAEYNLLEFLYSIDKYKNDEEKIMYNYEKLLKKFPFNVPVRKVWINKRVSFSY